MSAVSQTILVTGGAGYVGSHTVVRLIEAGYRVVILDNLRNSKGRVINRLETITGIRPEFVLGDIRDRQILRGIFGNNKIDAVVHFAGLKAVGESMVMPLAYYDTNVSGTIALLEEMANAKLKTMIFSSSATVYGASASVPIIEDSPLGPINPYGHSKLMVENVLRDLYQSDPSWSIGLLRYFNPVGAHESGLIGEAPSGIPNNLMPFIAQVAAGEREKLAVFGNDYPTPDGTGMRDYIHVDDLAKGHLAVIKELQKTPRLLTINLGTGKAYSVLEMIRAFEKVSGKAIAFDVVNRRLGDIAICYADPTFAKALLGWEAKFDIERMCKDAWRWQVMGMADKKQQEI